MGSKHNIYLSTCNRRATIPDCPLIVLCDDKRAAAPAKTFTAAAFFANTISQSKTPTEVAAVSEYVEPWEGTQRVARFKTAAFSSVINAGANTLVKGDVAGSARLGNEEFACFRDGETAFSADDITRCKADYWCASLDV
ncbi:hypothetical protein CC80DRAFT_420389 [Byssothecium circinans]|uniref:Uncharacterized protein n=1 Tax=Byssothecium circinans TaxID=147558 RepID=A0A6A5TN24_9PLEO|nr:hypothetical protein CC80DRAFT_420389 [Byssothecium circinans]